MVTSIAMIDPWSGELGRLNPVLYYVKEVGGRIRWSSWDGSHVGWLKKEASKFWLQKAGRGGVIQMVGILQLTEVTQK